MIFRKRIKVPPDLIERYRAALLSGLSEAPEGERPHYEIHLRALQDLVKEIDEKESVESIGVHISRERRSYGWSYLSGQHGSRVEGAFHELATLIEEQIFKIKGKDWYYSL